MSEIMKSAIREIGRQVREQYRAREWWQRHPYPTTMEQILTEELERRVLSPSWRTQEKS